MTNGLSLAEKTSLYDEAFLKRYDSIYKWGLYITKHNRELTEDLVHEVYVKFMTASRNKLTIESFDKYLFVALRNSYLSHLKRFNRRGVNNLAVIDFESVDHALLAVDPEDQIRARESLRAVCQYACCRKKTSISAGVLILRFFHGYYLNEVALILRSSRNVVDVRLRAARREAAAYLHSPAAVSLDSDKTVRRQLADNLFRSYQDTIDEFRQTIFAAREGVCLEGDALETAFQTADSKANRERLAHLVSCASCLNKINSSLRLPPLSERHPLDTLGKETVVSQRSETKVKKLATYLNA